MDQATDEGWAGAAFALPVGARLDADTGGEAWAMWRHLSNLIARQPQDLEAHTRRVLLACQPPCTGRVNEALMDLFLVLGSRGQALRERLLQQAQPWLAPEDHQFLQHHLNDGLGRDVALPMGTVAMLDRAILGRTDLVLLQRMQTVEQTPLQQAMSMIDDGDLDGARALLEESLLAQPQDVELLRELLHVYQYARDDDAKAAMQVRLLDRHGVLPVGWL